MKSHPLIAPMEPMTAKMTANKEAPLRSYSKTAKTFHWLTALLVLGMLAFGFFMGGIEGLARFKAYNLHKSIGITILVLISLRLLWRLTHSYPPSLSSHKPWEKILAKLVHFSLYGLLFLMPLSGWTMSSAAGRPVKVFDLFTMPDLVSPDRELAGFLSSAHWYIAWGIIGLVTLHIAGALKHHIVDKDVTLKRMLPFAKLALATVFLSFVTVKSGNAQDWTVEQGKSTITFSGIQDGAPFKGTFTEFKADINFDREAVTGDIEVIIQTNSVETALPIVEDYIGAEAWLGSEEFDTAVYAADTFSRLEDGSFVAQGELTLKGITKAVPLGFTLKDESEKIVHMTGEAVIDRTEFNVGSGEWVSSDVVAHDIKINVELFAAKTAENSSRDQ